MGKKKFIDKNKAAVFQVVHGPYEKQEEDEDVMFLKPIRVGKNASSVSREVKANEERRHRQKKSRGEGDAEEEWDREGSVLFPDEIELLRDRIERTGFHGKDLDEDGLPIDGYDYHKHLKPIGEDPTAVFLRAGGEQLAAKDVGEIYNKPGPKIGPAEVFDVLLPSVAGEEDPELLAAMAALEDPNANPDELFGGELAEDFVIQAAAGLRYEAMVEEERARALEEDAWEEQEEDYLPVPQPAEAPARPPPDLNDERFEALMQEYSDGDIGELEDEDITERGAPAMDISEFTDVIDQFNELGPFSVFKNPHLAENTSRAHDSENPYEILDEMRKDALAKGLASKIKAITETEQETQAAIDKMLEPTQRDEWDCETILTTYSNVENHPKYVAEPKNPKIKLSKKTGLPLPESFPEGKLPYKGKHTEQEEEEDVASDEGEGGSDIESSSMYVPNSRTKGETAAERRARKKAVKDAKKNRRVEKKETRQLFRSEQQRQATEQQTLAQKNPARVPL